MIVPTVLPPPNITPLGIDAKTCSACARRGEWAGFRCPLCCATNRRDSKERKP